MSDAYKLASITLAALFLASSTAMASGSVGVYYPEWGNNGTGFGLEGDYVIADSVRVFGEMRSVEDSDANAELDITKFGAGYVLSISDMFSLEVGGSLQTWDMAFQSVLGPIQVEDDVTGLHGIGEFSLTDSFHLQGSVEYLMFDQTDDETNVIGVRGTYDLSDAFSVFGGFRTYTNDDVVNEDLIQIGASFNF